MKYILSKLCFGFIVLLTLVFYACEKPTFPAQPPPSSKKATMNIASIAGTAQGCFQVGNGSLGYATAIVDVFTVDAAGSITAVKWAPTQTVQNSALGYIIDIPLTGTFGIRATITNLTCQTCCSSECGIGFQGSPELTGSTKIIISNNPSPFVFPLHIDTKTCPALKCCP